jgi:hypothetical protein
MLEAHPALTLMRYTLRLSGTPCGPMKYASPDDGTRSLLSQWRNWSFTPQLQ